MLSIVNFASQVNIEFLNLQKIDKRSEFTIYHSLYSCTISVTSTSYPPT